MKVLWMCNVKLNIIDEIEKGSRGSTFGGGWMEALAKKCLEDKDFKLVVCYPVAGNEESGVIKSLSYWGIHFDKKELNLVKYDHERIISKFMNILEIEKPDIIHLHGSEFSYAYDLYCAAKKMGLGSKVVLSIQGLIKPYAKYIKEGIPLSVFYRSTLSEMKNYCSLRTQYKSALIRGEYENSLLKELNNVIGRTDWDRANAKCVNPHIKYFKCNETLRDAFYTGGWEYERCKKHTILVTQASTPIKGFHKFIESIELLHNKYEDLKVWVTGTDIFKKDYLRGTSYGLYINELIRKYELENVIEFLGPVCAEKMKELMLSANVFVLPSAIENSPNSLGEAMLLGVPCITTDVGGVKNMILHNSEGFVCPYGDAEQLTYYVQKLFEDYELANSFSKQAKNHAVSTHDSLKNYTDLINIYKGMI